MLLNSTYHTPTKSNKQGWHYSKKGARGPGLLWQFTALICITVILLLLLIFYMRLLKLSSLWVIPPYCGQPFI